MTSAYRAYILEMVSSSAPVLVAPAATLNSLALTSGSNGGALGSGRGEPGFDAPLVVPVLAVALAGRARAPYMPFRMLAKSLGTLAVPSFAGRVSAGPRVELLGATVGMAEWWACRQCAGILQGLQRYRFRGLDKTCVQV